MNYTSFCPPRLLPLFIYLLCTVDTWSHSAITNVPDCPMLTPPDFCMFSHTNFLRSHDVQINVYIPFCRALAFSFPSSWSFLRFVNHAPIPADITYLFHDPPPMHSYSMYVRLNSILTVRSLTVTCFLGPLPRSSVAGTISDISFLDHGALLT